MSATPYLSIVAGSRNDDHGGNLLHRMQIFIEGVVAGCDTYGIDAELVLVEWNPPPDRPRLREALRWPRSSRCAVRIIEVPYAVHARFGTGPALPMHQMIAKNAGIRRARGQFVLATNIDIVLSAAVWERLALRDLRADRFYRAERHDVSPDVPEGAPIAQQLDFCRAHVLCRHQGDASRDAQGRTQVLIWPPMWQIIAGVMLSPLSMVPVLRRKTAGARRMLRFIGRYGKLHTNASGDFQLLAREAWAALDGYWEYTGFPLHIDSLLSYAAKFSGLTEEVLPPPAACAYHLDHGKGTGYREYNRDAFWSEQEAAGITHLTVEKYVDCIHRLWLGERLEAATQDAWGLANDVLLEETLD